MVQLKREILEEKLNREEMKQYSWSSKVIKTHNTAFALLK